MRAKYGIGTYSGMQKKSFGNLSETRAKYSIVQISLGLAKRLQGIIPSHVAASQPLYLWKDIPYPVAMFATSHYLG